MDSPEPIDEAQLRGPDPMPPPVPEREPFWGYADLLLFAGLTVPSMLFGMLLVRGVMAIFHLHTTVSVAVLLPEQLVGYAILFGALRLIFRVHYDRPFWSSLGWVPFSIPAPFVMMAGTGAAMGMVLSAALIHLPNTSNPMTELLQQGKVALVLMAAFGVGIAPLCEELAFRGFLQPLLVRSFGAAGGILTAGVAFGLLHFQEYGNSWRHALLLSGAGACFGWMRHVTKSSALMHASYNGFLFLLLALSLVAERNQHH
jgi:hypothetical protein